MADKKAAWAAFPYSTEDYHYEGASLKKNWTRLHRGDAEPWPEDKAAQEAWRLYHAGQFEAAYLAGREGSAAARSAAHKAACIYANYLETSEAKKTKLYQDIAARCEALQKSEPDHANAYYLQAYALGRYGQLIGVAKALAEGIGGKVRSALERTLELEPKHADAHIALGTFQAEVIEKVGAMIGKMTYGASKEAALAHYETALKLNPDSAIARTEMADGLYKLFGDKRMKDIERLYAEAAACKPMDAMEHLDVEAAKSELEA